MPGLTPSSPPPADDTRRGLVSTVAQTFAGAKTFLARIVATLGITSGLNRLDLRSDLGAGASDVCSVVGSTVADASVNSAAKLFSVRTGLGETEVERYWASKDTVHLGGGGVWSALIGSEMFWRTGGTPILAFLPSGICRTGYGFDVNPAFGAFLSFQVQSSGLVNQRGTDTTGSPGAATVDRPIGKSAIAAGAASVVITNSLVTAASHIVITPHARDATCKELIAVPAAGSFTVSGTANATAALPFSWRVATILTA